mmetsp:Transcript_53374/g.127000  ORF Transcript_53374/g.127000 Transcript_53374/m.127000 type:complete len:219 (+) Transcript_53374:664-1320(+)
MHGVQKPLVLLTHLEEVLVDLDSRRRKNSPPRLDIPRALARREPAREERVQRLLRLRLDQAGVHLVNNEEPEAASAKRARLRQLQQRLRITNHYLGRVSLEPDTLALALSIRRNRHHVQRRVRAPSRQLPRHLGELHREFARRRNDHRLHPREPPLLLVHPAHRLLQHSEEGDEERQRLARPGVRLDQRVAFVEDHCRDRLRLHCGRNCETGRFQPFE